MKLVIFGATGSIGRELTKQALSGGHTVTAFSRNPSKLDIDHEYLATVQGDVMNPDDVRNAVRGHDAVLCALGAGRQGAIRSEGTLNVIQAMQREGVRRLVCLSTLGIGESRGNLNFLWKYIMFGFLLRKAFADHVLQEQYIQQSGLDWIIVRPGAFTDGALTKSYRHGFAPSDKTLDLKVSRADVAHFMLGRLEDDRYLHEAPGVSY